MKLLSEQSRAGSIDALKAICAFLIVIIHAPFPGEIGNYITSITRIAVPIFFMISGYFYRKEKIVDQIKKIALLLIDANLLYLIWDLFYGTISGDRLELSLKTIVDTIFLNASPFSDHLWYLGAILYVLVIMWCAGRINGEKVLIYAMPFLLLGDLVLGKYSILVIGREIPFIFVRNFFFVGIPYYSLGIMMKDKRFRIGVWGLPVFILTTFAERFLLVSNGLNAARDHYISTTFLAITVMSLALEYKGSVIKAITQVGREYSTWIYIIHPIILSCYAWIFSKVGVYNQWRYISAIVVYLSSIILVGSIMKIKKVLTEK